MRSFMLAAVAFAVLTAGSQPAHAVTIISSQLNGLRTLPASGSGAVGFGIVALDDSQTSITVTLSVSNLIGFATSAGIYGPANAGEAGPLLFSLTGIAVPPSQQSFLVRNTFQINPDLVADLLARRFYFNVYSTAFPEGGAVGNLAAGAAISSDGVGGELRGQIDTPGVPEPATVLVSGLGLGLIGLLKARARRK